MHTGRRFLETVHLAVLGVWLGMLIMVGIAAAVMFPALRDLGVRTETFEAYPKDHFILAAGSVMRTLFAVTDWAGVGVITIAIVTLFAAVATCSVRFRSASGAIRLIGLLAAIAVLAYTMFSLRPGMNRDLQRAWAAAEAGDITVADEARASFDRAHPMATRLMTLQVVSVGIALIAGLMHATKPVARTSPTSMTVEGRAS